MDGQRVEYEYGGLRMVGRAFCTAQGGPRPVVLVAHDWSGCNGMALRNAQRFAEQGYVGFALDMYGGGQVAERMEDRAALMGALRADRGQLMGRIGAALIAAKKLPQVDPRRSAAIGFCFGGLCVLDLARSGADVGGVVSLHGLLDPPAPELCRPPRAQVLALHGYLDPMVPPAQVASFEAEMAEAQVDFQVHSYGRAMHAFANPAANAPKMGTAHEPITAARAFRSTDDFLRDLFASP